MCPQRNTTHEPRAVILSVLTLKKVNPTYYTVHVCSLYTEVVAVVGSRSAARRELRQLLLGDRARDALDGAADVLDLRVEGVQRVGARVRPATATGRGAAGPAVAVAVAVAGEGKGKVRVKGG